MTGSEHAASIDTSALVSDRKMYQRSRWSALRGFVRQKPLGAVGGAIIILLLVVALLANVLAPYSYDTIKVSDRLLGMSWSHPFGTDEQGRDIFSRIIYGSRVTVYIGFGAIILSTVIATVIGMVSGYFTGLFDLLMQRLIDIWLSFPGLIFVIFIVSIFSNRTPILIITLGLLYAAGASRIIRSSTISIKESLYVESARAIGASHLRILVKHIFPNIIPIVIITASIQIGSVILLTASLSFLGFGPPPPFPSWGRMLQEARPQMVYHPNLAIFPGLAIAIVVYAFNMFGDAIRDIMDPRMRGAR
jgi:peptide/nickel transport system permease protein